jgi:hypothetical protein
VDIIQLCNSSRLTVPMALIQLYLTKFDHDSID